MTLKVTERDKKLLVILAVFVAVVGIGAGALLSLIDKNQKIREELAEAGMKKIENEQKVNTVEALKKKDASIQESLSALQKEFYPVTPSMEIDRMLTEMALSHGVVVTDLEIKMPASGGYTMLLPYQELLIDILEKEEESVDELLGKKYAGVYTAGAQISMKGSREALQTVLDECAALEPKARIREFLWEKDSKEGGGYLLSMSVDLYMGEDVQQYVEEQSKQENKEKETKDTAQSTEEETDDNLQ